MNKAVKTANGEQVGIFCPGCNERHYLNIASKDGGPVWGFNHDLEKPTFTPSLLIRSGHFNPHEKPGAECWCTFEQRFGEPSPFICKICHSFIRDGMIEFLSDSTHSLAGKTVPLGDID